jgi:hypothetical protein
MTAAKNNFDTHIVQCTEAIQIYEFLETKGYTADFGLRFVWVASMSALDHFISELIVEKATEQFSNGASMTSKILNESVPLGSMLDLQSISPAEAIINFRALTSQTVRFRTFQKADDVADGLAYIWEEPHKWNKISELLNVSNRTAKRKLNSIGYRRDLIVHSADYNVASDRPTPCNLEDAREVSNFIKGLVEKIEILVP